VPLGPEDGAAKVERGIRIGWRDLRFLFGLRSGVPRSTRRGVVTAGEERYRDDESEETHHRSA
jgi:hypothetical protein